MGRKGEGAGKDREGVGHNPINFCSMERYMFVEHNNACKGKNMAVQGCCG